MQKTDRVILHCDMNAFYASVETAFNPGLRGKAVAVCGREDLRHGIVLAKSEKAKKCGVMTGEAIWQAKEKCPDLIVVEPHFERYVLFSREAAKIYREYTDLVEPFGLDECFLDVTASRRLFGNGVEIGNRIRDRIKKELSLTISVGVSFNKVFAKLGSDMKKPDALTYLPRETFREQIRDLPATDLLWVGKSAGKELARYGIFTIGDLANADSHLLALRFGKNGAMMKRAARGEDLSPVMPQDFRAPIQSVGHGTTPPKDLENAEEVWKMILSLTQEVGEKLRQNGLFARGIALAVRDPNLITRSFQAPLDFPTDSTMTLARAAFDLFRQKCAFHEPLRSLTVRAIRLTDAVDGIQLSLFQKDPEENRALDRTVDALRSRFGKNAVVNASLLSQPQAPTLDYVPFRGPTPENTPL